MAVIYHTCNLLPAVLVTQAGHSLRWLGNHVQGATAPARRDALGIHPMTCPYVTRLVAAADELLATAPAEDGVIVPGGCDAMRRLGDLLAATYPGRVFVLSLPRAASEATRRTLARDLARLDDWLRAREAGADGAEVQPPTVDYPTPPQAGGVFIVAGPLSDDSLLRLVEDLGSRVSGLESCTSPDRWRNLLGADAGTKAGAGGLVPAAAGQANVAGAGGPVDYEALADLMLRVGVCPRSSTLTRRAHLAARLDESRPSAIIYARQSFCDPGAYDAVEVARLAEERGLPFLEIEVGFPFEASGPLRTRVEAFLEAQTLDDDLLDGFDDLDDDLLDADLDDDLRDTFGEPEVDALMKEED